MGIEIRFGTLLVMVINFIILLVILIRLLYRPVQGILEQRRQKIISELEQAKQAEEDAQRLRHQAQIVLEEAHVEAYETVEKAKNEAEHFRDQLISEARAEVERLRQRFKGELARSQQAMQNQLKEEAVDLALSAVTKILGNKMSKELNDELIRAVVEEIVKEAPSYDGLPANL
ncbi:MAG TPA: F0F1 ATP synthase subunit B [Bacillota bacterium]